MGFGDTQGSCLPVKPKIGKRFNFPGEFKVFPNRKQKTKGMFHAFGNRIGNITGNPA